MRVIMRDGKLHVMPGPAEITLKRLGRDVTTARDKHKLSVADAAKGIGLSASSLRRIEHGNSRNCHGETLFKILAWAHDLGYVEFAGFSIKSSQRR